MGSAQTAVPKRVAPETGLEPHFHVTHATCEIAADGTILYTAYEEIRGELKPLYYSTMTPAVLMRIAQTAAQVAADAHNMKTFQSFFGADEQAH